MVSTEGYEETSDLKKLIESESFCRLTFFPELLDRPPTPLLDVEHTAKEIIDGHNCRRTPSSVGIYAISNCVLGGEGIAKLSNGTIFYRSDVYPGYVGVSILQGAISPRRLGAFTLTHPQIRTFDEVCASVNNYNDSVYGHFLIETMPKLYLLNILKSLGVHFKLIASSHLPHFAKTILSMYFPRSETIYYDPTQEIVHPRRLLFPTMLNSDYFFHPMMNCFVDDAIRRTSHVATRQSSLDRRRRLYLSRSRLQQTYRRLENEEEIHDAIKRAGFETIYPEELAIDEQIQLYRQSSAMISEYGSGSHNALFAPFGANVAVINRVNSVQSRISALRSQRLLYIMPADGIARTHVSSGEEQNYRVNTEDLERQIDLLVATEPSPS